EAILFYKLPNEDHSVYLAVYEEVGNLWKVKSAHRFDGGDVDIVEVGDFTGNGKRELLIGISVSRESLEHVMYVFSEENEDMKEIYNRSYTKLFIEDLNKNGLKDISLVTYEKDEKLTVE
ncbi:hypothetical protein FC699_22045, partial [Bacillus wiedmannii]